MDYMEQRQFERYLPPEGAIANFKPYAEFGLINDISRGGVAFECLSFSKKSDSGPQIGSEREIDIFIPGDGSLPIKVPCKVARVEKRLLGSYAHFVVPKKRWGVEFMNFGRETSILLDGFLARCRKYGY